MFTASIPESTGPEVLDRVVMVLGYNRTLTVALHQEIIAQIRINNGIVEEMKPL